MHSDSDCIKDALWRYVLQKRLDLVLEETVRHGWGMHMDKVGRAIFTGGGRYTGGLPSSVARTDAAMRANVRKAHNSTRAKGEDADAAAARHKSKQEARLAAEKARGGRFEQPPGAPKPRQPKKEVAEAS